MLDHSINLLEELDNISKVHWLESDDLDIIMKDFASHIVASLKIERVNIWLYGKDKNTIVSIGEYDSRTKKLKKDSILEKDKYPLYFNAIETNKIILAEDVHTNKATKEFSESYSKPNDIESLMDIPIRIAGELIGVICFEKILVRKKFNSKEQSFALSVALVLGSTLEARHRRAAQHKLDKLLTEKDLLIKEINHRVKNNFAVLIGLLRINKANTKSRDIEVVLDEYEQRILSMTKIHDMLCQSNSFANISLSDYLNELILEFQKSHPKIETAIIKHIDIVNCYLPSKEAIHIGLVITEILLNSIKHSLVNINNNYKLFISLTQARDHNVHIKIGDNGNGFDFAEKIKMQKIGLQLIKDLVEGMGIKAVYPTVKDNMYEFTLPPNLS